MLKQGIRVALVFASIFIIVTLILTSSFGYTTALDYFIAVFKFDKYSDDIFILITENKFHFLQCFSLILGIALVLVVINFNKLYAIVNWYINDFYTSTIRLIKVQLINTSAVVVVLPFLFSLYFAVILPVDYDEAWTYLNFTERGWLASLSYYPAPNNHVLNSLITNLTSPIPFLNVLIKLRIHSLLINVMSILVSIHFIAKYYNKQVALIISGVFPVIYMSFYYSYMARGYSLVLFFFILSLYFVFNITNNNRNRDWVWFSLFSVLGFYTMPSYLYVFIILNIVLLTGNLIDLKKQALSVFIVVFVAVLLYLPIIIVNGLDALINNEYVTPISRSAVINQLPYFFKATIDSIFGFSSYIVLIFLLSSIIILVIKKNNFLIKLSLVFIITPFLLLLIHSVIPFSRTFNYYGYYFIFIFFISISDYLNRIKTKHIIPFILLIQIFFIWSFKVKIRYEEDYSIVSKDISSKIIGNKKYIVDSNLFDAYLLYNLKTNKFNDYKLTYYQEKFMSADTISDVDFIIIDKAFDKTLTKYPIYATKYFNVY